MQKSKIYSNAISILFLTPLRAIVILIAPVLPFLLKKYFHCKANQKIRILYFVIIVSSLIGLLRGYVDFANVILYLWICFPIIFLLFGDVRENVSSVVSWDALFRSLRWWLIIIDVCGFICRFIIFRTVDDFGYAYGAHFKGVSGLSVVNAFMVLYYLSHLLKGEMSKRIINNFLFFFCSFIFCFSGLTTVTFFVTIILYFALNIKPKNLVKTAVLLLLGLFVLIYSAKDVLYYNIRNVELFLSSEDSQDNARKRVMYSNFFNLMASDLSVASVGVGPGGYNSRTCFLLNDDSNNIFTTVLDHHMPVYHKNDIFPLWNKAVVSFESFTDGARNKPFSSIVAFGAEVGLVFLFMFSFYWLKNINKFRKRSNADSDYLYLYLLNVFMFLLLLTEYWFESSEFVLFLIIQNTLLASKKSHKLQIVKS